MGEFQIVKVVVLLGLRLEDVEELTRQSKRRKERKKMAEIKGRKQKEMTTMMGINSNRKQKKDTEFFWKRHGMPPKHTGVPPVPSTAESESYRASVQ